VNLPALRTHFSRLGRAGFTLVDLLTLAAGLSIFAALGLARATHVKKSAALALCQSNLAQVGKGMLADCSDHAQTLPGLETAAPNNVWWWYKEEIRGYLGLSGNSSTNDHVFACPCDRGYSDPAPFHLNPRFDFNSYVFNGVTLPGLPNIAGWRLADVKHSDRTLLVMEWSAHAPLSWHESRTGLKNMPFYCDAKNVAAFVDGHVSFCKFYYDGFDAAYTRDPIPGYDYEFSGN